MSQRTPDGDSDEPEIVVSDPEDFARTRQLRGIFDARDNYIQVRESANALIEANKIDQGTGYSRVNRALGALIMQLEPLLLSSEDGQELFESERFSFGGVLRRSEVPDLEDPAVQQAPAYDKDSNMPAYGTNSYHDNRAIFQATRLDGLTIHGLKGFLSPPTVAYANARRTKLVYSPPSTDMTDVAFRRCLSFIQEIGLGFDMAKSEQQSKIPDKLLGEVEDWRRENVEQ